MEAMYNFVEVQLSISPPFPILTKTGEIVKVYPFCRMMGF